MYVTQNGNFSLYFDKIELVTKLYIVILGNFKTLEITCVVVLTLKCFQHLIRPYFLKLRAITSLYFSLMDVSYGVCKGGYKYVYGG